MDDRPWRRSSEGFKQWLILMCQVLAPGGESLENGGPADSRRPWLGLLTTDGQPCGEHLTADTSTYYGCTLLKYTLYYSYTDRGNMEAWLHIRPTLPLRTPRPIYSTPLSILHQRSSGLRALLSLPFRHPGFLHSARKLRAVVK